MTTRPRRRPATKPATRSLTPVEPLERRFLLSTINWTNRGTTDNFAIYGGNANLARTIVDRAIDDWERVIVNFNYAGGGNTYNLQVFAGAIGGRGVTQNVTNNQGKPNSARITMDDNGGGGGWYFDPVLGTSAIPDDSEYTGWINPFAADALVGANDFYRTIVHELGHAMGISTNSTLRISNFLADSGVDDPNETDASTIRWIDFGFGEVGTMTEAGGGHLYEGPALPAQFINVVHPDDLMNDGRTVATGINRRQLINDTHAMILREAYGYTVSNPSQHNTFHVNLNTQTNAVNIRGNSGNFNDTIHVDHVSGTMQFFFNGAREQFPASESSSIVISTSGGTNLVNLFNVPANQPVTVVGGDGPDTMVMGSGDVDSEILSPVTLAAAGGTGDILLINDASESNPSSDHYNFNPRTGDLFGGEFKKDSSPFSVLHNGFDRMEVFCAQQGGTINVNFVPAIMTLVINAGNNVNSIRVGNGDYDANILGPLQINGQGGNDSVTFNDTLDTGIDTYNLAASQFSKSSGGGVTTWNAVEFIILNGSGENGTISVTGTGANRPVFINAGAGTDTISVSNGDPTGPVGIEPSSGDDPVSIAGAAVVRFTATQRIGALTMTGGTAQVAGAVGSMVLTTTGINVTGSAKLDLTDETMVVDYSGASPISHVQQRLASGFAGGAWNGAGIISSTAATTPGRGIGFAQSTDLFTTFPASFAGQTVDNTAVLLKYARFGDTNLDGMVNLADFNRLAANFGQSGRRWSHGDTNYDETVNLTDFNRLAANFGATGAAPETRDEMEERLGGGTLAADYSA
jgi:hypothetical protein